MKIIEFIPLKGIPHIRFGMTRDEVQNILKTIYNVSDIEVKNDETDMCFENSLQFSYESDYTLSFIEAASPPPIGVTLLNIKTWELDGKELIRRLEQIDTINETISEEGQNPVFQNNIITFWDLDEQYDHIGNYKTQKWGSIGIGDDRYYKSICETYN